MACLIEEEAEEEETSLAQLKLCIWKWLAFVWALILVYLLTTWEENKKTFRIALNIGDEEGLAEGSKGVVNGVWRRGEPGVCKCWVRWSSPGGLISWSFCSQTVAVDWNRDVNAFCMELLSSAPGAEYVLVHTVVSWTDHVWFFILLDGHFTLGVLQIFFSWVWWYTPLISAEAERSLKELEASLVYIASPRPANTI